MRATSLDGRAATPYIATTMQLLLILSALLSALTGALTGARAPVEVQAASVAQIAAASEATAPVAAVRQVRQSAPSLATLADAPLATTPIIIGIAPLYMQRRRI